MSAKAPKTDSIDDALKELAPKGLSFKHKLCFFCTALVSSLTPGYIFYSKFFGMELSYYYVYIAVTLVSLVLIYLAYVKEAEKNFGTVMERKKLYSEANDEVAGRKEANSYSIFIISTVFLSLFGCLAFVILPRLRIDVPVYVIYATITCGAAVVAYLYGSGKI